MMVARLRSPRSEEETRIRWCGWPVMGQMGGARQLSVGSTPALLRPPEMSVRCCPSTGASASFIRAFGRQSVLSTWGCRDSTGVLRRRHSRLGGHLRFDRCGFTSGQRLSRTILVELLAWLAAFVPEGFRQGRLRFPCPGDQYRLGEAYQFSCQPAGGYVRYYRRHPGLIFGQVASALQRFRHLAAKVE